MEQYGFLQKSIEDFNKATSRLQQAYDGLKRKFNELNRELAVKNEELKRSIAERGELANYLENILESLITGVVVTDIEGKITRINRCAEIILGVSQDKIIGASVGKILPDEVFVANEKILQDKDANRELGIKIRMKGRAIEAFLSPMTSTPGKIVGTVFVLRDITRIEKLESIAKRTEKLASMGEMAANIAHQIRNPLGSIELFASMLKKDINDNKIHERLFYIIASVKEMDNKISNLLLFTEQKTPKMRRIDIHRLIKEVARFSEPVIRQGKITLSICLGMCPSIIRGDSEMIKQVFLNIILNAVQSMEDGGRLNIETRAAKEGIIGSEENEMLEIRFADTGRGIKDEEMKKIFDPLYSTRERGMGLGLAIVHHIVHIHGGEVDVESGYEGGTVFTVLFPLIKKEKKTAIFAS